MKLSKKLTAISLSVAVALTCVLTPANFAYAKGTETLLYEMYSDVTDAVTPTEILAEASQSNKLDDTGLNSWAWQYFGYTSGTGFGFPSSAGNVLRTSINDSKYPGTSLVGRNVVTIGARLFYHTSGRYSEYTKSISQYNSTAAVTAKVSFAKASYIKDAYLYLKSAANNVYSFTAIKLADKYITEADAGKAVQVTIPLSKFADPDDDAYTINGRFDPANFASMGVMLVNPTSDELGWIAVDDMRICNVLAPKNFVLVRSTDKTAEFSWDESESDVVSYNVYRNGEKIDETTDTTYTDNSLTPGENYEYSVCAVDRYGVESSAKDSTANVYASYVGRPKNFNAISSFADALKVHLTWTAPEYGEPISYEVYRDGKLIANTDANTFEYYDEDENALHENTYHVYYIKARSSMDSSMPTESINVFVSFIGYPNQVSVVDDGDSATIKWSEVSSAESYCVYRNSVPLATIEKGVHEYIDTTREYSKAYTYYVCAINKFDRSSLPSKKITTIKYEPQKKFEYIFTDSITDNYTMTSLGSSSVELDDSMYAVGKKSALVNISGGSFDPEGVSFTAVNPVDVTARRANGGRIEMFVYADNAEKLQNVKVALCSTSDALAGKSYTVRSSVNIADYIENYGDWSYVSIPIGDFPATGTYSADLGKERPAQIKFNKISGIDIYTDVAHYYGENSMYVDDLRFTDFDTPQFVSASLADGTSVASGDTISAKTSRIDIKFDSLLDIESLEGSASVTSASTVISADATLEQSADTVSVTFASALAADTAYTLKLKGLRAANGTAIPEITFDFVTDSNSQQPSEMADTEYVIFDSSSVTRGKNVKIRLVLDSLSARSTPVSAIDVTVKYDSDILNVSSTDSVSLAGSLQNAAVTVDNNNGIINIRIEKGTLSYTIGSYIADISFLAKRAGGTNIAVEGTFTQTLPEKTVTLAQNTIPSVIVTNNSESTSSGASGGGSRGGGRNEATAKSETSVSTTDSTQEGNKGKRMFSDSSEVLWAEKAIEELGKAGKINGYEDGTFKPLKEVTREEFAAMVIRALLSVDSSAKSDFSDVDSSAWYAPYIATAANLGITNGIGGTFGVGEPITRQDMCTMLSRAASACKISLYSEYDTIIFDDSDMIADYAAESVYALQRAGVINGMEDNTFAPNANVNRAMAAKVIYMLMQLM